jgi:alpha-1,3-rhamnosyl/mannosyltransferase
LQARKNIIGLIRAYARYRSQTASPAKLVLAGKRDETSEGIDEAIAALGLTGELKQVGYLAPPAIDPASLLPHLYSAAHMTVLPSFYEGFGIPVVEAMACGCPVIASNVTALPEIGGGAARLVNPESIEDMASALVELDCDAQLRARYAGLGLERARAFTWENCARQTLAAYEALAGGATATLSASSSPARD